MGYLPDIAHMINVQMFYLFAKSKKDQRLRIGYGLSLWLFLELVMVNKQGLSRMLKILKKY